jgi:putative endonuclease
MGAQAKFRGGIYQPICVHVLVYFEMHDDIAEAIRRERQLKKWKRSWKIELIEKSNPEWRDLWQDIL